MGEQEQGAVLAAPGAVLARDTGCTQLQATAAAQSKATSRQLFCSIQVSGACRQVVGSPVKDAGSGIQRPVCP